jgi:hypothetical protein
MRRISLAASAVAAMLFVMAASPRTARADQVDNPLYAAWAKFKPGSTATIKHAMHMEGGGMNMDRTFETTSKLVEVTPEKATLNATTTAGGRTTVHKQELASKMDSADKNLPKQIGQETITVDGKSYSCTIYDLEINEHGSVAHAKAWVASEVPGGVVKMESHVTQGEMKVTDQATLSHYEAK